MNFLSNCLNVEQLFGSFETFLRRCQMMNPNLNRRKIVLKNA